MLLFKIFDLPRTPRAPLGAGGRNPSQKIDFLKNRFTCFGVFSKKFFFSSYSPGPGLFEHPVYNVIFVSFRYIYFFDVPLYAQTFSFRIMENYANNKKMMGIINKEKR